MTLRQLTGLATVFTLMACGGDEPSKSGGNEATAGTGAIPGAAGTRGVSIIGGAGTGLPPSPMSPVGLAGTGAPVGAAGARGPIIPNPPQPMVPPAGAAGRGPVTPPPPPAGAAGTGAPVPPPPPAAAGTGAPVPPPPPGGTGTPKIPALTEECPPFRDSTITFGGLSGITMVAGAKAAGPTAPMVFYWHGTGSFAGEYAGSAAAVAAGVRQEGGVLISFQGTTGGDLLSGTAIFGKGDLVLADQLLACAVKNHNVDPKRVFSTGCSAGGLFSAAMATLRSSYMAASAPNSGGYTVPLQFEPGTPIPALMTMHGAAGRDVVFIDFSQSSATADKAFKAAGGFVINCDHGGIHCGAGSLSGDVWEFFKAHPYGTKPSPWTGGLPAGFASQCKIY